MRVLHPGRIKNLTLLIVLATAIFCPVVPARGSFAIQVMSAILHDPAMYSRFQQGTAIYWHSEHHGKLTHYHAGVPENASIRAVIGCIDPPGHPVNPFHVVKDSVVYQSFPPYVDGQVELGTLSFSEWYAVDWVGTYTEFAKTNYTINGGSEVVGDYMQWTFESF